MRFKQVPLCVRDLSVSIRYKQTACTESFDKSAVTVVAVTQNIQH